MLPVGIAVIDFCQVDDNGELLAVAVQCLFEFALRYKHIADPGVRHRYIVLPMSIALIGCCEALGDSYALAIVCKRLLALALCNQHIPH